MRAQHGLVLLMRLDVSILTLQCTLLVAMGRGETVPTSVTMATERQRI